MSNFKYDWSDLNELYTVKQLSTTDISLIKGCGNSIVGYMLHKQNIQIRNTKFIMSKYDWTDLKSDEIYDRNS
jgi:hypothetical protein